MNRIRYKKITEDTVQSIKTFLHYNNGARYIVRITPTQWMILDEATEMPAVVGHLVTKHDALKKVKLALIDLGIRLPIEVRKPRRKKVE